MLTFESEFTKFELYSINKVFCYFLWLIHRKNKIKYGPNELHKIKNQSLNIKVT